MAQNSLTVESWANADRPQKQDIREYVKKLDLPHTFIDVGWWYQLAFPNLPSGKVDYAAIVPSSSIPGDGTVKSALTDERDVGEWVKRIITDPRTLNQQVFAYNELWTKQEIYAVMEKLSGETIDRVYVSELTAPMYLVNLSCSHHPSYPDDRRSHCQRTRQSGRRWPAG